MVTLEEGWREGLKDLAGRLKRSGGKRERYGGKREDAARNRFWFTKESVLNYSYEGISEAVLK